MCKNLEPGNKGIKFVLRAIASKNANLTGTTTSHSKCKGLIE